MSKLLAQFKHHSQQDERSEYQVPLKPSQYLLDFHQQNHQRNSSRGPVLRCHPPVVDQLGLWQAARVHRQVNIGQTTSSLPTQKSGIKKKKENDNKSLATVGSISYCICSIIIKSTAICSTEIRDWSVIGYMFIGFNNFVPGVWKRLRFRLILVSKQTPNRDYTNLYRVTSPEWILGCSFRSLSSVRKRVERANIEVSDPPQNYHDSHNWSATCWKPGPDVLI